MGNARLRRDLGVATNGAGSRLRRGAASPAEGAAGTRRGRARRSKNGNGTASARAAEGKEGRTRDQTGKKGRHRTKHSVGPDASARLPDGGAAKGKGSKEGQHRGNGTASARAAEGKEARTPGQTGKKGKHHPKHGGGPGASARLPDGGAAKGKGGKEGRTPDQTGKTGKHHPKHGGGPDAPDASARLPDGGAAKAKGGKSGSHGNQFGANTDFVVNGQVVTLHTSCSQGFYTGLTTMQFAQGELVLVGFVAADEDGNLRSDFDCPGPGAGALTALKSTASPPVERSSAPLASIVVSADTPAGRRVHSGSRPASGWRHRAVHTPPRAFPPDLEPTCPLTVNG